MTQIATITQAWIEQIAVDLNNTYIDVDGAHGNQCWDSAARISQLLGLPVINTNSTAAKRGRWPGWAGNMYDAFPQTEAIAAAYHLVGPDQPAKAGDKAIWGDTDPYYPATHVADVIKDANALLLCISQNSSAPRPDLPGYSNKSAGPTIIQYLPKRGLLGYIRPNTTGGLDYQSTTPSASTQEIEDMTTPAELLNFPFKLADGTETTMLTQFQNIDKNQRADAIQQSASQKYAEAVNSKIDRIENTIAAIPDEVLDAPITMPDGRVTTLRRETSWTPLNFGALQAAAIAGAMKEAGA